MTTPTSPARSKRVALLMAGAILLAVTGGATAQNGNGSQNHPVGNHAPSPIKITHPIIIMTKPHRHHHALTRFEWASACTHSPPRDDARVDGGSDRPDRCRIVEEPATD